MKYSIIIAVYNRLDEVVELLKTAEALEFEKGDFEILFVDDGSTDGFKNFVENYKTSSTLNIRTIYQTNKGPGAARNSGMKRAFGDYFLFVDSDCLLPKNWLDEIERALKKNNYDAFGGPDAAHRDFSPLLKAISYCMTSFIGTGGTRGRRKSVAKFYPRSFNMGVKKEVFKKIGGMSTLRHGQDLDFSQRIYNAGFNVGLIEKAFVYHKRRVSIPKYFRQIVNWGVARINLGRVHKELLKPIHFLPLVALAIPILMLVLTMIYPKLLFKLWIAAFFVYFVGNTFAFIQSYTIYRSLRVSSLVPLILNIQVFAYGFGQIWALFQVALLGRDEAEGFVKNYYGKKIANRGKEI